MKSRHILIPALFMALAGGAMAQNAPAAAASGMPSNDPLVQKRQADADAKADYKAEQKAAKSDYKADKKAAKKQLKQSKKDATAERDAQMSNAPKTKVDKTP